MGEHHHERQPRIAQLVQGDDRLGHLHEGEHALLHARAAGRGNADQRNTLRDRGLGGTGEPLADDRSHRSAKKAEVHRRHHTWLTLDRQGRRDDRLGRALRLGRADPIGVRLQVYESQRVRRAQLAADLGPDAIVG